MFNWFKNLFKNKEVVLPTDTEALLVQENSELWRMYEGNQALIKGQDFAIEQQQVLIDTYSMIISSLLLNQGAEEFVINEEFIHSVKENNVKVAYEFNEEGNMNVWIEYPEGEIND